MSKIKKIAIIGLGKHSLQQIKLIQNFRPDIEINLLMDSNISSYYRVVPGGVSKQIDKMVKARHAIRNKHFKAIASKDLKLAKKFDFTIAFWNFVGISHTGEMGKWIRTLLILMISNPIYSFVRIRDIGWSFKTLIASKFRH